ncbi:MAG: hypothetical protein FJ296_04035 [Planctomycetes bacterium]|nr:hypothetical protein [Planctomycetota bacterium]
MEPGTLLSDIALPLALLVVLLVVVRHGPFRHRWWGGETLAGFALTVGCIAFAAGFFGPILLAPEANQGPLLGVAWGGWRAAQRRRRAGGEPASR